MAHAVGVVSYVDMKISIPTPEKMAEQLIKDGMSSVEKLTHEELYKEVVQRLTFIGAYRLQPYWMPFLQEEIRDEGIIVSDQFRPRTHWEDVLSGYMFDRRLRNVFFDGVSRVEVALRAVISQSWAELAKHERPHLNMGFYKPAYIKAGKRTPSGRVKLWKLVEDNFRRSREAYSEEHEDVRDAKSLSDLSIWSFMEFTTLGNLESLLCNGLKKKLQHRIAQKMGFERADFFVSGISLLTRVRNACAHQARVWNRYWLTAQSVPMLKSVPDDFSKLVRPDRVGAALTFCQMVFNTIAPQSEWKARLQELLESRLCPTTHIHKILGFHTKEWLAHSLWNPAVSE